MTLTEQLITIGLCVIGTVLMRALPFIVFNEKRETPSFIKYLGKVLPPAVFGMLVVYCLRNINIFMGSRGIPEFIAIAVTVLLHLWKKQMMLSIAGGTVCYMLLIHFVFV